MSLDERCPYPRPFTEGFDGCPAYQPRLVMPLDLGHAALTPVWTCSHLHVGASQPRGSTPYSRCALGAAEARGLWVAAVHADRLLAIREFQHEFHERMAASMRRLQFVRQAHLQAMADGEDAAAAAPAMEAEAKRFFDESRAFLEPRARHLEDMHLPLEATMQALEEIVRGWLRNPSLESAALSDEAVAAFPTDIRVLFRPELARTA